MSHAAHFLRRLDRVSDAHVELALTLYRDPELLRETLSAARVPEGAERVAISLEDPVEGPFVVVTREGRFVTCLGPGMRASGVPIVARDRLEVASARVQRMREELGRVRELRESGAEGEAGRVLRRMQQCGPQFAREDAEVLLRVRPLIAGALTSITNELVGASHHHLDCVARLRLDRLSESEREYVLTFGDLVWGVSHGSILALSCDRDDDVLPDELALQWAVSMSMWGTTCHAQRALWLVAQRPRALLPLIKRMPPVTMLRSVCAFRETALATIACASSKSRAEAIKAMGRGGGDAAMSKYARALCNFLTSFPLRSPEFALAMHLEYGVSYGAGTGAREPTPEERAAVPDDVARAAWASVPLTWLDAADSGHLHLLAASIPWLARARPEEMFLPRKWARRLAPPRSLEDVLHWVQPAAREVGLRRVSTLRREGPKLGRNDPCACGSGRKHKHCCARAAG